MNVQTTHVQVSASLRRQPLWKWLGPALTSTNFTVKESTATAIDLVLAFPRLNRPCTLRVLILTADTPGDHVERIKAFSSTIKQANALDLILLLSGTSDGIQAMLSLQMLLLDFNSPALLIAKTAEDILPILERHLDQLKHPRQVNTPAVYPKTLVAQATSSAPLKPLSEHHANVLTDLFPSMRELEKGTRTAEGQTMIEQFLGATTAKEVIEFWEDEWLV